MTELERKLEAIQSLLRSNSLDALLLQRASSFAWATCGGASYINTASSEGAASLLITPAGRYLITTNIEAPRMEKEEKLMAQGWDFQVERWDRPNDAVARLTKSLRLGVDGAFSGAAGQGAPKDLSAEISRLRANLLPEEVKRFKEVGKLGAEAMNKTMRTIQPGMTEYQIAGLLAGEAQQLGVQAIVVLVATDRRIFNFRHPLPTSKKIDQYGMVVLCGRRYGLVVSLTRFIHFGKLPAEIKQKAEACAYIDATFLEETRPGKTLGEVFQMAQRAYAKQGFANEWELHHQGGTAAYEPREYTGSAESTDMVAVGQAYAWNPSITGTKSEDTFVVGKQNNEVISAVEGWPMLAVELNGKTIQRPAILQVD